MCNMNPLRYSKVQDDYELMSAVQVAASKWGINLNAFEEDDYYNVGNLFHIVDCNLQLIIAHCILPTTVVHATSLQLIIEQYNILSSTTFGNR